MKPGPAVAHLDHRGPRRSLRLAPAPRAPPARRAVPPAARSPAARRAPVGSGRIGPYRHRRRSGSSTPQQHAEAAAHRGTPRRSAAASTSPTRSTDQLHGKSSASSRASTSRSATSRSRCSASASMVWPGPLRAVGADHAVGERLGVPLAWWSAGYAARARSTAGMSRCRLSLVASAAARSLSARQIRGHLGRCVGRRPHRPVAGGEPASRGRGLRGSVGPAAGPAGSRRAPRRAGRRSSAQPQAAEDRAGWSRWRPAAVSTMPSPAAGRPALGEHQPTLVEHAGWLTGAPGRHLGHDPWRQPGRSGRPSRIRTSRCPRRAAVWRTLRARASCRAAAPAVSRASIGVRRDAAPCPRVPPGVLVRGPAPSRRRATARGDDAPR